MYNRDLFNAGLLTTPEAPIITRGKLESVKAAHGKRSLQELAKLEISGMYNYTYHSIIIVQFRTTNKLIQQTKRTKIRTKRT